MVHDDGLQCVVEWSICHLESKGVGGLCAIFGYYFDSSRRRNTVRIKLYLLLRFCLDKSDGRKGGNLVRQVDCIFAYSRIVVESNTININKFELSVATLRNRESDGVVCCGDTILCHYVDSGRLVKTRIAHCNGLS